MSDTTLEFTNQLKAKRICRFCLTQDEPLTNIYSTENRKNLRAPLPLQVMSCVSIEVFTNDEMPSTICKNCRLIMDYCYRFKQMCKNSDTMLKQFPLTGVWPNKLEHPKYPKELLAGGGGGKELTLAVGTLPTAPQLQVTKIEQINAAPAQTLKRKAPPPQPTVVSMSPPKKKISQTSMKIDMDSLELNLDDVEVEFIETEDPELPSPEIEEEKVYPVILNKSNVKILNKQAPSSKRHEAIIRQPILQTNEDGTIEIVSEIVAPTETSNDKDPLRNANPVPTNVFPCEFCERSFPLRQLLDIHAVNHVRDRNFTCEVCQKGFFSKYDLNKHSLIHTGERPFKCIVCDKAFSRSTLLRRHEKMHSDHPKFLCAYCERPFLCKEEWEKHTLNHQKKRPFECTICLKTFAFKQGLERHEGVHAADHPFKCDHCPSSFPSQGKLARHLTAHAGSRPYPCRICTKSYLLSHHLTRHMRSHKSAAQTSFECHECLKTFTDRDELINHSASHAAESLMCPLCKEQFDDLDTVTEHIKQHMDGEQYACEFCDSIFLTEDKLQEHSDAQHTQETLLYDNDDRKRKKQRVEVLESFTIVGDVLVPNNASSGDDGNTLLEYKIDTPEEYTIIAEGNDFADEDPQQIESGFHVKQEPVEISPTASKKPLRSYGNANKSASSKAVAVKKESPAQKPDKVTAKPTTAKKVTEAAIAAKIKPLRSETKSPVRQSDRKWTAIDKPAALPTRQSPKTRSNATIPATTAAPEKKTPVSNEKKFTPPSVEKQQTLTQWVTKKSPAVAADTKEVATKKIISTRSGKPSPSAAPIKPAPGVPPKKSPATGKLPTNKAAVETKSPTQSLKIGDKMVEVKQIRMTKTQIEDMKKQGKIQMKDGRLCIFKK